MPTANATHGNEMAIMTALFLGLTGGGLSAGGTWKTDLVVLAFCLATALAIGMLTRRRHVEPDSAIGIMLVRIVATVECRGPTGVEMEALTAAAVGLLTVYDMVKAVDRGMALSQLRLEEKSGGRSGVFRRSGR